MKSATKMIFHAIQLLASLVLIVVFWARPSPAQQDPARAQPLKVVEADIVRTRAVHIIDRDGKRVGVFGLDNGLATMQIVEPNGKASFYVIADTKLGTVLSLRRNDHARAFILPDEDGGVRLHLKGKGKAEAIIGADADGTSSVTVTNSSGKERTIRP